MKAPTPRLTAEQARAALRKVPHGCPDCYGDGCAKCGGTGRNPAVALIREWGDLPGPRTDAPKPSDPDMVQLPAVRCTRAQREAWTRIAKLRGTTVSGLVRDMFERLGRGERWEKDE